MKHADHQKGCCRGEVESAWTADDNRSTCLEDSVMDGGHRGWGDNGTPH